MVFYNQYTLRSGGFLGREGGGAYEERWPRKYGRHVGSADPSLQFVLTVGLRHLYIYKDFEWELLNRVIYKTLYGNPLDFSKIYDNIMNDEIKSTYLLFSVYLSVLCSFGRGGGYFGQVLLDMCRWPLRTPTLL